MRNNELKHHRFYKGLFVRHGLFSFASLFKRLSTSKRIHLGIAITALFACLQLFIFADRIVESVGLPLLFVAWPYIFMRKLRSRLNPLSSKCSGWFQDVKRTITILTASMKSA